MSTSTTATLKRPVLEMASTLAPQAHDMDITEDELSDWVILSLPQIALDSTGAVMSLAASLSIFANAIERLVWAA
ncbi:hypothetical protein DEU56DRAFT_910018 [Suillus clintonianus]|uniref:uncharacterized protein n=1 Tax=Suillus clintonianus TaxID=1904413 RepID=UPI001B887052|nr:uncharacterized protein DEU56DRAFT_910018 [Suillus clintonianus]KAG2146346.1 hypothetical protein DEU56DRAFT_910018 [Suillus clintonianus]